MLQLQRRFRTYKTLQWTCFALSLIAATVPGVIAAFKVAHVVKDGGSRAGLAGYAVCILCIAGLIIFRALSKKYSSKLPWALSAVIWAWALTILLFTLQKVIDEALYITFVFAIGTSVAFLLSCLNDIFCTLASQVREEYKMQKMKE